MFEIEWEFEVGAPHHAAFAAAYGPEGAWVRLFRQDPDYRGTELRQLTPTRWRTVDRWTSRASYDAFRQRHAAEYAAIDARCEHLTIAERKIAERST